MKILFFALLALLSGCNGWTKPERAIFEKYHQRLASVLDVPLESLTRFPLSRFLTKGFVSRAAKIVARVTRELPVAPMRPVQPDCGKELPIGQSTRPFP